MPQSDRPYARQAAYPYLTALKNVRRKDREARSGLSHKSLR